MNMNNDYIYPMNKKNIILGPSHVKVQKYVSNYIKKNIYSPEIGEIAKGVKLTPRQTWRLIEDLISLRYLSKSPHKKRSLKVERELVNA